MHWTIRVGLCVVALSAASWTFRAVAADEKKTTTPLEPYRYPNAKGGRGTVQGGNMYCERLTSSDDFEKVAAFYQKKVGSGLGRLVPDSIQAGAGQAAIDDSEKRSVSLRIWIDQTDSHFVTVVVSRTREDKVTHIVISYWKRK